MSDPFAPIGGGKPNGHAPAPASPQWTLIAPAPPDAPSPPARHPKLGAYSARWTYRAASGDVLGYVLRFDGADGKQFRPLALYAPAGGGAPGVALGSLARPASALWPRSPRRAAFRLCRRLRGRKISGRRDAAVAGFCMRHFAQRLEKRRQGRLEPLARARRDHLARCRRAWPRICARGRRALLRRRRGVRRDRRAAWRRRAGWDAADAEAEGWTPARALDLIGSAEPIERPAAEGAKKGKQKKERRARQRDVFMELTRDCVLWHGADYRGLRNFSGQGSFGDLAAALRGPSAVGSRRAPMRRMASVPGGQALEDVTRVLEARAVSEGEQRAPWRRVGARDGCLYIDLADAEWRAVKITATGRELLDAHDLPFVRSPRMRALCAPLGGYSIGEIFRPFANVAHDDDFILIVAWLVASFRERGPYPILVLNGEQGSGKSSFARRLRSLLDPSSPPIQGPPKDEQALDRHGAKFAFNRAR